MNLTLGLGSHPFLVKLRTIGYWVPERVTFAHPGYPASTPTQRGAASHPARQTNSPWQEVKVSNYLPPSRMGLHKPNERQVLKPVSDPKWGALPTEALPSQHSHIHWRAGSKLRTTMDIRFQNRPWSWWPWKKINSNLPVFQNPIYQPSAQPARLSTPKTAPRRFLGPSSGECFAKCFNNEAVGTVRR